MLVRCLTTVHLFSLSKGEDDSDELPRVAFSGFTSKDHDNDMEMDDDDEDDDINYKKWKNVRIDGSRMMSRSQAEEAAKAQVYAAIKLSMALAQQQADRVKAYMLEEQQEALDLPRQIKVHFSPFVYYEDGDYADLAR